jgi:hypothetical protein
MTELSYFLSRIRALPAAKKQRWAMGSRGNQIHRAIRKRVLKQWLEEVSNPT